MSNSLDQICMNPLRRKHTDQWACSGTCQVMNKYIRTVEIKLLEIKNIYNYWNENEKKKSPSGSPMIQMLASLMSLHKSLKLSSLYKIPFSFCHSDWLIHCFVFELTDSSSSHLLSIPLVYFSIQLWYVLTLTFIWYFLIFPISLLKFSLCLSTPVLSFSIFIIHYFELN